MIRCWITWARWPSAISRTTPAPPTSTFSSDAREYVSRIEKKIVLVDGRELAALMVDFGIGVAPVATYEVKRVDTDYFSEEG